MAEEAQRNKEYTDLIELFKRVDKKNAPKADIEKLEDYLRKYPKLAYVGGDLVHSVQKNILEDAFSTGPAVMVSVEAYCNLQRDELGYKTATPIERLLIENVVLCWLRLHLCELRYQSAMEKNISLTQAMYWEKKLSAHQKRYLRAIETLARIRKLNLNIQINIGEKQLITG